MHGKHRRGMTLIELMVSAMVLVLILTVLLGFSLQLSRVARNTDDQSGRFGRLRQGVERMVRDIQNADLALTQWPPGTAVFRSNSTDTLVLRQPRFDANNQPIPGSFTIVIYRLEAVAGGEGPLALRRYLSTLSGGIPGALSPPLTIATSVHAGQFRYRTIEQFLGDDNRREFTLRAVPQSIPGRPAAEVMVGSINRLTDGTATVSGGSLTFGVIPRWGVAIDVGYYVSPSAPVDPNNGNGATAIEFNLTTGLRQRAADSRSRTRDNELEGRADLRNRI